MRLLVVSQYFWPENFRINDLVAELVRRGHQVTVMTGLPNYPDGEIFAQFRDSPEDFSIYEGAEVIRVSMTSRGRGGLRLILNYLTFAVSASAVGLWKLRGRQFDAIFTYQGSPVTVGLPAALMRAVKRVPMAIWVLDLWPDTLHAVGVVHNPVALKSVGKLVSFIYKRCDLILAQSKSFIPKIQEYALNSTRIMYFPSWAESVLDMSHVAAAEEVPPSPGSFDVMFAGNIGDAQDFPAILAAAEILKPHTHIRLLIVGDGRMGRWVANEIKQRGLQESVLMLGRHPIARIPSFFMHASALLVSLKDEPIFSMTIPGKIQSYLAAGIPVVAMLNGEGADVIRRSGAGLTCAAGDHVGLANAVLTLSKMSRGERDAMGENGLVTSALEFGREKLIDQLEDWLMTIKSTSRSVSIAQDGS